MHVLVVEPCRGVVPLGDLDWFVLVDDRDDVQSVCTAVSVIIGWNRVKVAVGQFVVDKHPVVVRGDLDVNHAANLSVVRREKDDVVWLRDVQDFELVVRRHIGVAATGSIRILDAIFHEIAFDCNFGGVAGGRSDVLVFRETWPSGNVVEFRGRGDISVAVEVVVINENHVVGLQSVGQ